MEIKTYREEFGGKPLFVEIGRLANQANGSCRVQYGETTVLITATMSAHQKSVDYMPLSVDYEEKYYAAGKIKGSKWIKRESRPSEEAILSGRLIDRSIRPRFDQRIRNEIQVVATVLTFDGINDPDMPALFGASLALMISDIPFDGPIAGIRVGRIDGKLIFNPTYLERQSSDFDIVVAGTENRINMIEAGAKIVPEKDMAEAIKNAFKEFQKLIKFQKEIVKDIAPKKKELVVSSRDDVLAGVVSDFVTPKLEKVLYTPHKQEYVEGLHRTSDELVEYIKTQYAGNPELDKKTKDALQIFEDEIDRIVHKNILESEKRPDGRKIDQLRALSAEVGVLPHSHGTGLFNRGTTQALSVLTLASPGMEQWIETMEIDLTKKRFMHHYVFPPFSVGEVGRMGGLGRREVGHGALAERALLPLIPSKDDFPYTIRVVSEILSSNGSSSMASVCGSTLAMMDGGVPIKDLAAGIAMGLMFDPSTNSGQVPKYKILTDIQGPEDHHGDMDLKVAGTKDGVTAMQMDVKIEGINQEILEKTLEQAKKARLEILSVLSGALKEPRKELSVYAPRIQTIKINPEKIGAVIGPQGKIINDIIDKTGATIDIEDDGSVFITSDTQDGMDKAIAMIKDITYEAKIGDEFDGTVVAIKDFGAFVEILPGKDGMVHISEMSAQRVNRVTDILKMGQKVHVWVKGVDENGRISLTMKPRM
ncbi:MAG: polyribonucleotide nucleotidyltransferase [Candidatus Yanofskybacteria bacterium RIFCSPHIGHO2_01_FULL_41_27]|uniref:Polyribonucleotide nucleotidyltransferase n=2 Tax=Candidatus Yanofskyibacteriota TaxID=1752733 RepID=A0A1F8HWY3_9BACT|nr:MAG: polyribonucleotide nucleotidyltransferase [Candidatus Yanofskybacteria bacterium RIFCSPHIGHO2_01_FULL_41_27]OGN08990.1 MAG: polyribonucleotide nucleotidyltransferase [Candidatus Yanofskybacteria bacterium RIFCSPHIGHO2_02_FULL_41_12]OGN20850.1 MAG: polyribonucleotide nucleotidyltransferase [Candidatus Yanofskybacteria bacterium RIFCSPLOWO2_01_FULL_41_33]OGN41658.1 MAG: polyribonucleotide nucleotidyltransferase [Candidatus Yanofskybacteria bacterium RIFOXYD1_FULL_42_10]